MEAQTFNLRDEVVKELKSRPDRRLLYTILAGALGGCVGWFISVVMMERPSGLAGCVIGIALLGIGGWLTGESERGKQSEYFPVRVSNECIEKTNGRKVTWKVAFSAIEEIKVLKDEKGMVKSIFVGGSRGFLGTIVRGVDLLLSTVALLTGDISGPNTGKYATTTIHGYESMDRLVEIIENRTGKKAQAVK